MTRQQRRRRRVQRGVATLVAFCLLAVVGLAALASSGVVAIVVAHRRAQSAADLAALAAAQALQRGADPCTAGRTIAAAQRATMTGCRLDGAEVVVEATVGLPRLLGGGHAVGRARAGPAP